MRLRARTSRRTSTMMMMTTITMIMMLVMSRVKVMIRGVCFFLPCCSCYSYSYYACFHKPAIHHFFYDDQSKPPCNDFSYAQCDS